MKSTIISEREIYTSSEDKLDRNKFAINLANKIKYYDNPDALTIGIVGSWGSGKSSLINLTLENLKYKDIIIIRFNPWFFSNQENLYYQFFKLLILTLKRQELKNNDLFETKIKPKRAIFKKTQTDDLKEYLTYIENAEINMKNDDFLNLNLENYESLDTLKEKCNNYFNEIGYKIVVVIDDIDRLVNNEIEKIFILVKSLADFNKFVYILSFDKQIVENALETPHSDYEHKFIEKIIQIQIQIPDIAPSKLDNLILKCIKPIYNKYFQDTIINKNNDFNQVAFYLRYFIDNIRDLKRYANILEFYLNGFVDNINIDDCFLILAMQLFEYQIYTSIKKNKNILTTQNDEKTIKRFYSELKENKESINMNDLKILLRYLFPILKYPEHVPNPNFKTLHKKHKVGSKKHFNKYFTLSLEANEVDVITINNLTKPINSIEIYRIFDPNNNREYNEYLFDELLLIQNEIPIENCETIISRLLIIGDELKISRTPRRNMIRIIDHLFKKLNSKDNAYEIFKRSIDFENNIFTITDYIHHLSIKNKLGNAIDDLIFNEKDLNQLENLISSEIKHQVETGILFYNYHLSTILSYWKTYEDAEIIKNAVIEKTKDDFILLEFLKKHNLHDIYNYSNAIEPHVTLDFEELREHYFETLYNDYFRDLNGLNARIIQISKDKNISDDDKKFCDKFTKHFKKYKQKSYILQNK